MKYLIVIVMLTACGGSRGAPGINGAVGPTGANGFGLVALTLPTVPEQCPNGGHITFIAQDVYNSGVFDSAEPVESTFITCNGLDGAAGVDTTPVTEVQLCPNNPRTAYAATFSEVALCISDKLYGVYSTNGGFMTEIVPGTYSSNGINSSCTFAVGANCTVTQQ